MTTQLKMEEITKLSNKIDVSEIPNGLYFVNFKFEDEQILSQKLIITHD